jgi:hypothetical protein
MTTHSFFDIITMYNKYLNHIIRLIDFKSWQSGADGSKP